MNWFTLVVNSLIIVNLIVQHQQMLRLHRYQDLDSSSMHKLFRAYFYLCFIFAIASVDLHHFKLPSLPSLPETIVTTENMGCSIFVLVISFVFIVSMHTSQPLGNGHQGSIGNGIQEHHSNVYYSEELERQLLLSTETFKSSNPVVQIVSTPVINDKPASQNSEPTKDYQSSFGSLRSKDISPIQSYGNNIVNPQVYQHPQQLMREMEQTTLHSQLPNRGTITQTTSQISQTTQTSQTGGRKYSAVKTPILSILLNADNVIAATAGASTLTSESTPEGSSITHWMTALPVMITLFYVLSQCVYSLSVMKTSVYTPYKPYILSSCWSILLGSIINISTLLGSLSDIISVPCSSLVQFATSNWLNYAMGTLLILQGVMALAYYLVWTRRRVAGVDYAGREVIGSHVHVQVYNSMSSPSLQSVY